MFENLTRRVRNIVSTGSSQIGGKGSCPHVVIVGAGFAGLSAAQRLAGEPVEVTLIDRNNYHKFQPLLYQVATAGLEPDDIAHSVRDIFRRAPNVHFKLATVSGIDAERKRVATRSGLEIEYDQLILAAGAVTSYFGVEGAREHSFPLKNIPDAVALRNRVLRQFERFDRRTSGETGSGESSAGTLNFVVVGGGPTGVETAGALTELFRVMQNDYKRFDTTEAEVFLIEMTDHLLPAYEAHQGAYARRVLEGRGVRVMTGATVERVGEHSVHLQDGRTISTETLIWAAGVAASAVASLLQANRTKDGRLKTGPNLGVAGCEAVFAVGDMSASTDAQGRPYPQLAPVAIQQGEHAAEQILRRLQGRPTEAFAYRNLGKMATIGRNAAVAELPGGVHLEGFLAWLTWVFIHIAKLVGFRNRARVFINWIYNYFTYDRAARLILDMVPISDQIPGEVEEIDAHMQEAMQEMEAPTQP